MAKVTRTQWVVTISSERPINAVAEDLKARGFEVNQVLEFTGNIIIGSASEEAASKLRSVPGVADVSPDHEVYIGPPGAPIS